MHCTVAPEVSTVCTSFPVDGCGHLKMVTCIALMMSDGLIVLAGPGAGPSWTERVFCPFCIHFRVYLSNGASLHLYLPWKASWLSTLITNSTTFTCFPTLHFESWGGSSPFCLKYIIRLKLTVKTQLVYVGLFIFLSEWLHVSAPIRPSSGHKQII